MKVKPRTTQKMARQAFGLLLELRERENAHQLLAQAIAFLEMLGREKDRNAAPIMLSVHVMQLRKC
jgi:CRISPR/Cas system CMR-associated protein Cmr1 (group 7 of RAMP superfamily)